MSLENWQKFGWLKAHKTSRAEIVELVGIADRDIEASNTEDLHDDWRFNIAYNAALQLANAALAASGYRVEHGGNQHYRAIDSLSLTLGTDAATIKKFEVFRKKRNVSDYERVGSVSESDVKEMRAIATKLREEFETWIAKNHADLKP